MTPLLHATGLLLGARLWYGFFQEVIDSQAEFETKFAELLKGIDLIWPTQHRHAANARRKGSTAAPPTPVVLPPQLHPTATSTLPVVGKGHHIGVVTTTGIPAAARLSQVGTAQREGIKTDLTFLAELRDAGLITEEQFAEQQRETLKNFRQEARLRRLLEVQAASADATDPNTLQVMIKCATAD